MKKWRPGPDGVLEEYDTETGEITGYQKPKRSARKGPKPTGREDGITDDPLLTKQAWVKDASGRMVIAKPGQAVYRYDQSIADQILALVSDGLTVRKIAEQEGFPPKWVIWKWMRQHKDFKAQFEEAKRIAAHDHAERALEEAELAEEDNVQSKKLLVSTLQWSAEVHNRERYGRSTKIVGDINAPVAFTIVTGVPQQALPEPEEK